MLIRKYRIKRYEQIFLPGRLFNEPQLNPKPLLNDGETYSQVLKLQDV